MRKLTVKYTSENGIDGSFTYPKFPELTDFAAKFIPGNQEAQVALAQNQDFVNLYWGWVRQVLVTWRAQAKRVRTGNKTTQGMSEKETAVFMGKVKLPTYDEPTEIRTTVAKLTDIIATLSDVEKTALAAALGLKA